MLKFDAEVVNFDEDRMETIIDSRGFEGQARGQAVKATQQRVALDYVSSLNVGVTYMLLLAIFDEMFAETYDEITTMV